MFSVVSDSMSSVVSDSMSSVVSDSMSSNLGSMTSNLDSPLEQLDGSSDVDLSSRAYVEELLEHGLKEERFRIDRKKLEDMLQTPQNASLTLENAEVFFQRVMFDTSTQISWPSKLKIGAKSKKDPHVKIVGKPEDVQLAKERILEILDTKKNRVTIKMDVSHSDHSYIIGKGGFKIQQVMEETGCHIHFPDSNRNSAAEKSNQVSIAGQAAGVEMARSKIRDLLPLVFTFELPNGETVNPGEECSPAVQHIQQTYSFNVAFRPIGPAGMGRTLLVVRGCQRLLSRLRQGLALLMEYLTGSKTIPVMGFMKTEIAAQHHSFVAGPCNAHAQAIMSTTGATLLFPESSPPFDAPLVPGHAILRSKSTVIIQGSFDSVCLAWQELLKCLPLVLMFDLKEGQELDPVMVNNFMETFNINIMVRPKMKENTKSVLIRGAEKDSRVLFQVRKEILNLDDDEVSTSPLSFSPSFRRTMPTVETTYAPRQHCDNGKRMPHNISTAESLSMLSNIIQQNPQIVGLLNNLSSAFPSNEASRQNYRMPPHHPQPPPMHLHQLPAKNVENWINRPDRSYAFSSGVSVSSYLQQTTEGGRNHLADDADSGVFMPSPNRFFNKGFESKSEMSSLPESSASSTSSLDTPDYKSHSSIHSSADLFRANRDDVHHLLADYGSKKVTANQAMQQPVEGVRTPTMLWSGYGFSKSMPDFANRAKRATNGSNSSVSEFLDMDGANISNVEAAAAKAWNADLTDKCDSPIEQVSSPFALSNFWENVPRQPSSNYTGIKSLEQLLRLLDLYKYHELFLQHEIDLSLFLTLTEVDLQQLNISYFARRKMLAAISAIREQRVGDWTVKNFRAAPGAERRTFLPRFNGTDNSEEMIREGI